jgi:hypothetical protein
VIIKMPRSGDARRLIPSATIRRRVDVQPGIGFVQNGHRPVATAPSAGSPSVFSPPGKPLVQIPVGEGRVHFKDFHVFFQFFAEIFEIDVGAPPVFHGRPQKVNDAHTRHGHGVLKPQEKAFDRPFVGLQRQANFPLKENIPRFHLIARMAHHSVRQGAFP